ncbi:MAG: hypothetical protein U0L58_08375 [Ruminococcus sp.]|nr:hypothetical protein [Ruminococcus sp.]
MIDAVLAYIVEDTTIADSIIEEIDNAKLGFNIARYPVLGNSFWNELSDGAIDSKNVFIICSKLFGKKYEFELKKYIFKKRTGKYNFILITPADESKDEFISRMIQYSSALNISVLQFSNTNPNTKIIEFVYALQIVKNNKIKSINSKKNNNAKSILVSFFCSFMSVLLVLLFNGSYFSKINSEINFVVFLFVFLLFLIIACLTGYAIEVLVRQKTQIRDEQSFKKELDDSLSKPVVKTNPKDFSINNNSKNINEYSDIEQFIGTDEYQLLGHLKLNWRQMRDFYEISTKQARKSFFWAIIFCIVGLIVIVLAIVSPLFTGNNSLVSLIGAIGGAVVEVISGTVFFIYKKSLSQMNLYHEALSQYQHYLNCVNLVSKLSYTEKQDELYEKIILTEINKTSEFDNEEVERIRKLINSKNGKQNFSSEKTN